MGFDIEKFLSLEGYDNEKRRARRKLHTVGPKAHQQAEDIKAGKTTKPTAEFFTPYSIVKRMADKIPDEDWADPKKKLLEPCFGNGQFVIYMVYKRLENNVDWKTTLETLYGVELMQDNVDETKDRVVSLLNAMGIDFDEEVAREIMDKNLVCSDFFKWDFELWRPLEKPLF